MKEERVNKGQLGVFGEHFRPLIDRPMMISGTGKRVRGEHGIAFKRRLPVYKVVNGKRYQLHATNGWKVEQ